jgi:phage protein D
LPAKIKDWKADMEKRNWLITKVVHKLSNAGFVTEVEFEEREE